MLLRLLSLLLAFSAAAPTPVAPLLLRPDPPGLPTRAGVVVRGFSFLEEGAWPVGTIARIATGRRALPSEVRVVARHRDGSARAVRLVAVVPPRLASAGGALRVEAGTAPDPSARVEVTTDRAGVRLDTGAVAFLLSRDGPGLLNDLRVGSRRLGDARPSCVVVEGARGRLTSARERRRAVRVEREGRLRVGATIAGRLLDDEGGEGGSYVLRIVATAGSPCIEGALEVRPSRSEPGASDLALEVPFDVGGGRRATFVGALGGGRFACGRVDAGVYCLDGQALFGAVGDARIPIDAARRAGVVVVGGRGLAFGGVQSRTRALAPRATVATRDARLRIVLHHGPMVWEPGTSYHATFSWMAARATEVGHQVAAWSAEPRAQLVGDATVASWVIPGRVPIGATPLGTPEDPTGKLLARVDESIGGEWGSLDHGDYRHPWGWANLEYDPAAAFLLRALAADDARHEAVARSMLEHWVRRDRSHGERGAPVGMPWMHGREHRSYEWEAGHVWAEGLVLGVIVLGDRAFRSAAEELRSALVAIVREHPWFEHEREYAWSLLALHDLALLGPDEEIEEAARELFDRLVRRQDAGGWFRIDSAHGEDDAAWAVTPWVTGGITAEAIDRHRRWTGDPRAARALDRIGDFLVGAARLEDGRFARKVLFAPEARGPVAKHGHAGAVDELLLAAGLGRALGVRASAGRRAVFEEVVLRSSHALARGTLTANAASRALVGVRALADVRAGLGGVSATRR